IGSAVLIAAGIVVVGASFPYLGFLLAIVGILFFGLFLPIYLGEKNWKRLAIWGLVILLLATPIAGAILTETFFEPSPQASSYATVNGNLSGPVLANASVTPFSSPGTHTFVFDVTLNPQYLPSNDSLVAVDLYLSQCPTATGTLSDPDCAGGYPQFTANHTFNGTPVGSEQLTFNESLAGPTVWYWTMYAQFQVANSTASATPNFCFSYNGTSPSYCIDLEPSDGSLTVQGPVVGSTFDIFSLLLLPLYGDFFLYLGSVFYIALGAYAYFKYRERRRKDEIALRSQSSVPTPGPGSPPIAGASPPTPATAELHCPNCQAVVYATETRCWKCGAVLSSTGASPLPSSGAGGPKS
ncbi:MAG: hypothetical protein L3K03_07480, partial [Thermoplasmata archaeon]|nr:hypothetical protein [Thermoplasmata archaeon]